MSDTIDLPSVAGRMEMTHEHFQRACQVELGRLQEDPNCDTRLVHLLCEAVRCSRECCEIATAKTIDWKARCEKRELELYETHESYKKRVADINDLLRERDTLKAELERVQKLLGETMDHVPSELRTRIVSAVADAKSKGLL